MEIALQKKEIINWINSLENQEVLNEIESIKSKNTFDFETEWARSISGDELRKRTTDFLKTLPWKK